MQLFAHFVRLSELSFSGLFSISPGNAAVIFKEHKSVVEKYHCKQLDCSRRISQRKSS